MKAVVFHDVGDIRLESDIFPTGYFCADLPDIKPELRT